MDGGRELVAQVPVLGATTADTLGEHLGTVMIGEASPTVWQRLSGASSYLLAYLGIASVLGLVGSWLLARRIKRQTLGLEPREIAGLAEHREAMLYGIAEGVIALDPQLRLTLVNDVGRRLLDLPEDCVGHEPGRAGHRGHGCATCWSGDRQQARPHEARRGRRTPRPGAGDEPDERHQGRPPARLGHDPARPHRTGPAGTRDRLVPQLAPNCCARRPTSSPTSCTPSPG